jgi:hypothetical protein
MSKTVDYIRAEKKAIAVIESLPDLEEYILGMWEFMNDEIEDGSSEELELERFLDELAELEANYA